jgi:hypothetical protein
MPEDREYRILDEGNAIVARLRERYPKAFWPVVPEQVLVLAVTNKPRPFTMKRLAKITKVDAAHRTVIRALGRRDVRYLVELYLTDWTTWNGPRKQWILAHEIGHIDEEGAKGLVKHDVEDWGWLLDSVGIDWWTKDNLPDLLDGDPYPFRQELFDRLRVKGEGDDEAEGRGDGGDSHGNPWGQCSPVDSRTALRHNVAERGAGCLSRFLARITTYFSRARRLS